MDASRLTVSRSITETTVGVTFKDGGKTDSATRTIPLRASTVTLLREHKASERTEMFKLRKHQREDWLLFFPDATAPEKPYWPSRDVGRSFNNGARKWGYEIDFYGLRHTFATLSLQAGVHVKTVSKQLGHKSITITLDRYAQVLNEMEVAAASKVDEFWGVAT